MQPVSADDPQIASGDEASLLIEDLVLRFDRDVRGSMQYPHDRLPRPTSTPSIQPGSRAGRWASTLAATTSVCRPSNSSACWYWQLLAPSIRGQWLPSISP